LPPGVHLPQSIQQALSSRQGANGGRGNIRESLQRKQMWWLPYIVLEFDKNEILVDALGGELDSPVWHYRASL
jgi:serum/glucocorticoid-regulated kinase 2